MKTKERLIHVGILAAVFVFAIIFFSHITNQGNDNMTADMDAATLPQISFTTKEYGVNILSGYVDDMDIARMRGVITPIYNSKLSVTIQAYDAKIKELEYTVYTLDGGTKLESGTIKDPSGREELDLSKEGLLDVERVIKISLDIGKESPVNYYTRIADGESNYAEECVNFAHNYHEDALGKAEESDISDYLETDAAADNSNYAKVGITNNYEAVTWGNLSPSVKGKIRYNIMELRANYTSIKLEYKVNVNTDSNNENTYKVTEFFKIRYDKNNNKYYLLDYNRTMNQMVNTAGDMLSAKGINLGITDNGAQYKVNGDGTIVSFVQAGEVWNYNKESDELSKVFSFQDAGDDERNLIDNYDIKLLNIDDAGNTTFGVYGYMNRGSHEGQTGVGVYYYDISKNSVDEKMFIESRHSYETVSHEMGQLIYYSTSNDMFYAMVDGTLYEITTDEISKDKKAIVSDLDDSQYAISDSGERIAYESKSNDAGASEITILSLEGGEKQTISSKEGEFIKPLGFVSSDFVYGVGKNGDKGKTKLGETVDAMYKVIIQNSKDKILKTYEEDSIYSVDAIIQDNMITLKRVMKDGDMYNEVADDYIMNNEEKDASNIYLEGYSDKKLGTLMRLTFANGISDKNAKILTPKMVLYEKPITISFEDDIDDTRNQFYVYGHGRLQGVYTQAGNAVLEAENSAGVVVDEFQSYIWERGNRSLQYSVADMDAVIDNIKHAISVGKTPMEAVNESDGYYALNLTGISTEQAAYLINKNTPVIAVANDGRYLVLTGYDASGVGYIDAASGEANSDTYEGMDSSIIAFIGMASLF